MSAGEDWVCPKCGAVMQGPDMLCSGSFLDRNHPANVRPRPRDEQTHPAEPEYEAGADYTPHHLR